MGRIYGNEPIQTDIYTHEPTVLESVAALLWRMPLVVQVAL